jgi:hypothetical protein
MRHHINHYGIENIVEMKSAEPLRSAGFGSEPGRQKV